MIDYPRKLIDRDPRKFEHRCDAFKLMVDIGEVAVTEQAAIEIKKAGGDLPETVQAVTEVAKDSVIVCAFYFLDEGLIVETNIIGKCSDCSHPVQLRSYMPAEKATLLCCFCAADRTLVDYWKTRKSGSPETETQAPTD